MLVNNNECVLLFVLGIKMWTCMMMNQVHKPTTFLPRRWEDCSGLQAAWWPLLCLHRAQFSGSCVNPPLTFKHETEVLHLETPCVPQSALQSSFCPTTLLLNILRPWLVGWPPGLTWPSLIIMNFLMTRALEKTLLYQFFSDCHRYWVLEMTGDISGKLIKIKDGS